MRRNRMLAAALVLAAALAAGGSAHARTAAGTLITNIAAIWAVGSSGTPIVDCQPPLNCTSTPSATAYVSVLAVCSSLFEVTKEIGISDIKSGGDIEFRIVIANIGLDTATAITLIDTLSPLITNIVTDQDAVFGPPTVSDADSSGTRYVWSASALLFGPGDSFTFTVTGLAGLTCSPVSLSNTAFAEITQDAAACTVTMYSNPMGINVTPLDVGLSVTKYQTPAAPGIGDPVTYQIIATNTGEATLTQFTVVDVISPVIVGATTYHPVEMGVPTVTDAGSGTRYEWSTTGANLTPGSSYTFTVTGNIGLVCAPTSISNTAYVSGGDGCSTTEMYTNSQDIDLVPREVNISVTKYQTPAAPGIGDPVMYEIIVTNEGTATLTDVSVVDIISPVIVGATTYHPVEMGVPTVTDAASGTRYEWSAGGLSLTPGSSYTFTVTGNIGLVCAPTSISNTAYVSANDECSSTEMFTNSQDIDLTPPVLGVSVTKEQDLPSPTPGQTVSYRIVVENTGTATVTELRIWDTISPVILNAAGDQPAGLPVPTIANADPTGTLFVWDATGFDLGPGASYTFTITGQVAEVCVQTVVTNTAFVEAQSVCGDTTGELATGMTEFTVDAPVHDFAATKVQIPASPGIGEAVRYLIVIENTGDVTISNLTVRDTVPPTMVDITTDEPAWSPAPVVTPIVGALPSGSVYEWHATGMEFSPNTEFTFTISGFVDLVCAPVAVSNTAYVMSTNECTTVETLTNREGYSVAPPIRNLVVFKEQEPANPGIGEAITYRIIVLNAGTSTITDLTVVDTISPVVVDESIDQPGVFSAPTPQPAGTSGTLYVWSASGLSFEPGDEYTFTITGDIGLVCAPVVVSNTAYVIAVDGCGEMREQTNAVGTAVGSPASDVSITKTQLEASPGIGETVTYVIQIQNTGSATVTNLELIDTISPVVQVDSTDAPSEFILQPLSGVSGGTLYLWTSSQLSFSPADVFTFTVSGHMQVVCAPTQVDNTAVVAWGDSCTGQALDRRAQSGTVGSLVDAPTSTVSIVKTQLDASPGIGEEVRYQILVSNTGSATITDLMIWDTVSPVVLVQSSDEPDEFLMQTFQAAGGTRLVWSTIAGTGLDFPPATALTFTVTGRMQLVCAPTQVNNTAVVYWGNSCNGHALNGHVPGALAAQSNTVGSTVQPPTLAISVTKFQEPASPGVGETVTYRIVATNTGSATITSMTVVDTVSAVIESPATYAPVGFTLDSLKDGSGTVYAWNAPSISFAPGVSFTFTITGPVGAVCVQTEVTNTAFIQARAACGSTEMITNVKDFFLNAPILSFSVEKVQIPPAPGVGDPVEYRIYVSNTGQVTITDMTLWDTVSPVVIVGSTGVPAGFTLVNDPPAQTGSGTVYSWSASGLDFKPTEVFTFTITGNMGLVCVPTQVNNAPMARGANYCAYRVEQGPTVGALVQPPISSMTASKVQKETSLGVGETVTYHIVVRNDGTATITSLTIWDTVSPVVVNATADQDPMFGAPTISDASDSSGTLYLWSWAGTDFYPSTEFTFTIQGQIGLVCAGTQVNNTARVLSGNDCSVTTDIVTNTVGSLVQAPISSVIITKQQTAPPPGMGEPVDYRIVVRNNGTATVAALAVIDTVSPTVVGVTTVAHADFGAPTISDAIDGSGTRYVWTATGLNFRPGDEYTFTITGAMGLVCAPTQVSDTAYVAWAGCGSLTDLNMHAASNAVGALIDPAVLDMTVIKYQDLAAPAQGETITYRVVATNTGSATITSLTVTDMVSPVIQITGSDKPADMNAPVVTQVPGSGTEYVWTSPAGLQFNPGESFTFTITGQVMEVCVPTTVYNTATLFAEAPCDLDTGNMPTNRTEFTLIVPVHEFASRKIQDPANPGMGDPVKYLIVVENTGGVPLTNVLVTDTVSPVVEVTLTDQPSGFLMGTYQMAGGTLYSWLAEGISLPPGAAFTFTISGAMAQVCAPTQVSNTAYIRSYNDCTTTEMVTNAVGALIDPAVLDMTVIKYQDLASPAPGETITYRVVATNTGSATITSLTVTDMVSPVIQITGSDKPADMNAPVVTQVPGSGTEYVWTSPAGLQFNPGESFTFTITGQVMEVCIQTTVYNTATLFAEAPCDLDTGNMPTNRTQFTVNAPVLDFTVNKIQNILVPGGGGQIRYNIHVRNQGQVTITSLRVEDTVSPVIQVTSTEQPAGFGVPSVTQLMLPDVGTKYVWSATGLNLEPTQTFTFTVNGGIREVCSLTQVNNTAVAEASGSCLAPGVRQSPTTSFSVAPHVTNLVVSKRQTPTSPGVVPTGGTITYEITVANMGSATVTSLTVEDQVPSALSSLTSSAPAVMGLPFVSPVGSDTLFRWSRNGIALYPTPPNNSFTFTISGQVLDCGAANITDTAYVEASTMCSVVQDFTNQVEFSAECIDMTVVKEQEPASPATVSVGDMVRYRIVITNIGGLVIEDLEVVDTVPAVLSTLSTQQPAVFGPPTSSSIPEGTYYIWQRDGANMAPGATYTFTITGYAAPSCSASAVENRGWALGVRGGGILEVYRVTPAVSVSIQPLTRSLTGSQSRTPPTPVVGGPVTYQIVVRNAGLMTITAVTVTDTLPPQIVNVTTQQPAGFAAPVTAQVTGGTRYVWSAGPINLAPNATLTFTITGQVGQVCAAVTPVNASMATGVDSCGTLYARPATTSFSLSPPTAGVSVNKTQTPISPATGEQVTYRIVVTNTGSDTLASLTLIDTLSPVVMNVTTEQHTDFAAPTLTQLPGVGTRYVWSAGSISLAPNKAYTFTITGNSGPVCVPTAVRNAAYTEATSACGVVRQAVSGEVSFAASPPPFALTAVKTMTPAAPVIGGDVTYRLIVTNVGEATTVSMVVTDTVPAAIVNVTAYQPAGFPEPSVTPVPGGGSLYSWNATGLSLAPNQSFTFTLSGQVDVICAATYVGNSAYIEASNACGVDVEVTTNHVGALVEAHVPDVTLEKDWVNALTGLSTPLPAMGQSVTYTIDVVNSGTGTAFDVAVIDTIPTQYGQVTWEPMPPLWTRSLVGTTADGSELWVFRRSAPMSPASETESISFDYKIYNLPVGGFVVENVAHALWTNTCTGLVNYSVGADARPIAVEPPVSMTVRIFNSVGELVKTFDPVQVGTAPNELEFVYTADAAICGDGIWVYEDRPMSPDGDCTNDWLTLVFPDLIMEDGSPYDDIVWDGTNDDGAYVANGIYQVVVSSVDTQSGAPVTIERFITVFAKRTEVVARIFNAAGEEVAVLDTAHVDRPVARIEVWPNPFEPLVKPYVSLSNEDDRNLSGGIAYIRLLDENGAEIDSLEWYGRTCPASPDHICQTVSEQVAPAEDRTYLIVDGQIVNNGVYMIVVSSTDPASGETRATAAITVSHGKLDLVKELMAVPNPVSQDSLESGRAKVWVRYEVAGGVLSTVLVKVYNVASELVTTFDATEQPYPADPLGLAAGGQNTCPAGATCGTFAWDGRNSRGDVCASGLYLVVVEARDVSGNLQREIVKIAIQ